MASDQVCKSLRASLDSILSVDIGTLVADPRWGTINFESVAKELRLIHSLATQLGVLKLEMLSEGAANDLDQILANCRSEIESIQRFSIDGNNPRGIRDQIADRVRSYCDQLLAKASAWIPFLAYQSGDMQRSMEGLTTQTQEVERLVEATKGAVAAKSEEMDTIIAKAREASAQAGAAVFTADFNRQADRFAKDARVWLRWTSVLAVLSLGAAVLFYLTIIPGASELEAFQRIAAKLAVLGVLITATLWCGRIYKALMHQAATYRFKALGLQTFQAFSAGAADRQTKDTVLLETTRSIFSNPQTGYIDESGSSDTQIVEVLKSAVPSSER